MISNTKLYKKITKATAKLVDSLTTFEEGSENYEACVKYSLSQFQNHRFLDVNRYKVSRQLNGLREKFIIHSQPEKAEIFKELETSYLASDLSEESTAGSEIHYALLSILLNLSENPVNKKYNKPTPKVPENEELFDWAKYLLEGEELLHPTQWAWDDTPPASDDEEEVLPLKEIELKDPSKKKTALDQCNTVFDTTELGVQNELVFPYWNKANTGNNSILLTGRLETFQVPTNTVLNEVNIIREILWLLAGQTELSIFPVHDGKRTVCKEINLFHMTPAAMKDMLQKIARYGDFVQDLRAFIFSDSYKVSQTYQAFSESLLKYFKMFQGELLSIERSILEAETTLLIGDVYNLLAPRLHEIFILHSVMENSVCLDTAQDSCAKKVSRLLGQLYNVILDQTHTQCPTSKVTSDLLQIWIDSIRPYIDIIDNWVSHGSLNDPFEEFILQRSDSVPDARSESFWLEAFRVASVESMKYLSWLKPVLNNTIVAGKSVEVLTSLGTGLKQFKENESLYMLFIDRIGKNFQAKEKALDVKKSIEMPVATCDSLLYLNFEHIFKENVSSIEEKSQIRVNDQVPLPIVIQRSICSLVQEKCQHASRKLLEVFKEEHHLKNVIQRFHQFHLMGWGDVMYDFTTSVFQKISGGEYWEDLMSLRASLQESISESKPEEDSSSIAVVLNRSKQLSGGHQLINVTDIMELYFKVEWPLNIIITKNSIKCYNLLFSYLVQVKRALFCLENLKFGKIYCNAGGIESKDEAEFRKAHRLCLLRSNILRLVSHWHNFIMTSVIQAEKETFLKHLESAEDLDGIITAHDNFLDRMCTLCLLKQEKQADKMIQGTLQKIFGLCVVLHTKWNRGLSYITLESLKKHEAQYKECSEFLGIILQNLVSRGAVPLSLESLAFCLMS